VWYENLPFGNPASASVGRKSYDFHERSRTGLPDGLFSNQKSNFGKILEGHAMEDDGIFYGHSVHFTVFWDILWAFGVISSNLVYFSRFGILYKEKSGNSGRADHSKNVNFAKN
jgi:hypothetical protein